MDYVLEDHQISDNETLDFVTPGQRFNQAESCDSSIDDRDDVIFTHDLSVFSDQQTDDVLGHVGSMSAIRPTEKMFL
jgi:hypothetical protein